MKRISSSRHIFPNMFFFCVHFIVVVLLRTVQTHVDKYDYAAINNKTLNFTYILQRNGFFNLLYGKYCSQQWYFPSNSHSLNNLMNLTQLIPNILEGYKF